MGHLSESTTGQDRGDCWALAYAALSAMMDGVRAGEAPLFQNLLLYGPPGTGKSYFALRHGFERSDETANVLDVERLSRVYLTEETPAVDLRGGPLPDGTEWHWVHGPAIRAWQERRRLVLDEIDKASADALAFLLAVLDDRAVAGITLPTGERVRPARGFHVVATTNGEPDDLPEALRDRFTVAIAIDEPHPDAIAALRPDLREVARVTAKLDAVRRISIRKWRDFDKLRERFSEEAAAALVFGTRASEVLDGMRIGADADAWKPAPPCWWAGRGDCRGDGRGVFRDGDDDPICRGCTRAGRGTLPIRTPDGEIVRAE